jgi:four helix bundle protein
MELGYRKSIAWQKNQRAIIKTAQLLERLPEKTPFQKIAGQLFSSVSSVGANIAEGYSDYQGNEYQRYLKISLRSAFETDHWLITLKSLMNERNGNNLALLALLEEIDAVNAETIRILLKTIKSIREKRHSAGTKG